MITEEFRRIAEKENGDYKLTEEVYPGELGARIKVSTHQLRIEYKGHEIYIENEFGNTNLGKVHCSFSRRARIPEFEIFTRTQFWKLFNRKADIIEIKCPDQDFTAFAKKHLFDCKLEEIAQKSLFQPQIKGILHENGTNVNLNYHLAFDDKEKALEPIICFFKSLVNRSHNDKKRK